MKKVISIGTEWFSKKGGLSTFNRRLCIALSKENKVYCFIPDFSIDEEQDALALNIKLIKPKVIPGMDTMTCMINKPNLPESEIDIIIGHDRITGSIMQALRNNYYSTAITVLFIHTTPAEIEIYKTDQVDVDSAEKAEEREKIQKDLAVNSSLVAAVGPKLFNEFTTSMAGIKIKPPIIRFDPGLYEDINTIDYSFDSTIPEALMMGRIEDFDLKGVDFSIRAMDKVYTNWNAKPTSTPIKPRLVIRGATVGSDKKLRLKSTELIGESNLVLSIKNYTANIDVINEDIRRSAIILMPSRAEGFGLVALEAISLGRPILVAENSGFAMLLKDIAPDEQHYWIIPNNSYDAVIEDWAREIRFILLDRKAAGERLKRLVEIYSERIDWNSSIRLLMERINQITQTIESNKKIFFNSNSSIITNDSFKSMQIWDSKLKASVGNKAIAEFQFVNGLVSVKRKNSDGRNILTIKAYNSKQGILDYIPNTESSKRKLRISFQAKVVSGSTITVFIVVHKKGVDGWYFYEVKKVKGDVWQEFISEANVSGNAKFFIEFQEKDYKGSEAIYQIKDIIIQEAD